MIYLHRFSLPSEGAELHFLTDSRENRRTCYTSRYPFGIFFGREVPTLELEPVTILCGGNGSGKTTVLNLMGEKLSLRRGTDTEYVVYFPGKTPFGACISEKTVI